MNILALHIEYLLRHEDCVIIPTFGAFIAGRRSAYFDREAGVILPPDVEIMFNASIVNNDGMLVNSIVRRLHIPYNEAQEIVTRMVSEMRATLRDKGALEFGRLGKLTMGCEGNIIYTPTVKSPVHLGLQPLRLIAKPAVAEEPAQVKNDVVIADKEKRRNTDKYYYIPVHKTFAKIAASMLVVLAVALAILMPRHEQLEPQQNTASVIPVSSVRHDAVRKQTVPTVATKPVADTVTTEKYHLVVGTFTTQEEVDRFVRRHADKGFNLQVVKGKRYIRVTAGNSTDREELVALMRSEKVDTCFRNPWIWKE